MNKGYLVMQTIMLVWGIILMLWGLESGDTVKSVAGHVWLVGSVVYGRIK